MSEKKDNEINIFYIQPYNGIMIGFGWFKYIDVHEFEIKIPFLKFGWSKQMVSDEDADKFLNNE